MTTATTAQKPTVGAPPVRKGMDAQEVGKINAAAMRALGDVDARRKWVDIRAGSPLTTNMLCAEIARLNIALEGAVGALGAARPWIDGVVAPVRGLSAQAAAPGEAVLAQIDMALAAAKGGA